MRAVTASDMSEAPPPALTSGASTETATRSPARTKTTASSPSSGTRTFDPFPSGIAGSPSARAQRRSAASAGTSSTSAKKRAGPPIRHVVRGARGSSGRSRRRRPDSGGGVDHDRKNAAAPARIPAKAPARRSSAITPHPPGSDWSRSIGPGLSDVEERGRARRRGRRGPTGGDPAPPAGSTAWRTGEGDRLPRDLVDDDLGGVLPAPAAPRPAPTPGRRPASRRPRGRRPRPARPPGRAPRRGRPPGGSPRSRGPSAGGPSRAPSRGGSPRAPSGRPPPTEPLAPRTAPR